MVTVESELVRHPTSAWQSLCSEKGALSGEFQDSSGPAAARTRPSSPQTMSQYLRIGRFEVNSAGQHCLWHLAVFFWLPPVIRWSSISWWRPVSFCILVLVRLQLFSQFLLLLSLPCIAAGLLGDQWVRCLRARQGAWLPVGRCPGWGIHDFKSAL